MSTKIATTSHESLLQKIDKSEDAEFLSKSLADAMNNIAANVEVAAHCLQRLTSLGLDTHIEMSAGRRRMLLRVAEGCVNPKLISDLLGVNSKLLTQAVLLSPSDQQKIIEEKPIKLAVSGGSHRMVKPSDLTDLQIKQVFNRGSIRTHEEQVAWMQDETFRTRKKEIAAETERFEFDRRKGTIHVLRECFLTKKELLQLLSELEK